jgi:hypothetical protein
MLANWGNGMENYEGLEGSDKEVERILNVLRSITGPYKVLISEPKLDTICYRCKQPMCSVDEIDMNTYFQCFACGHKEMKM